MTDDQHNFSNKKVSKEINQIIVLMVSNIFIQKGEKGMMWNMCQLKRKLKMKQPKLKDQVQG